MGRLASLFSPFWCLDAKGGEVALFRLLPDLHGLGTSTRFDLHLIACVHFYHIWFYSCWNYVGLVMNLFV